jgi:hypothetical protein
VPCVVCSTAAPAAGISGAAGGGGTGGGPPLRPARSPRGAVSDGGGEWLLTRCLARQPYLDPPLTDHSRMDYNLLVWNELTHPPSGADTSKAAAACRVAPTLVDARVKRLNRNAVSVELCNRSSREQNIRYRRIDVSPRPATMCHSCSDMLRHQAVQGRCQQRQAPRREQLGPFRRVYLDAACCEPTKLLAWASSARSDSWPLFVDLSSVA